MHLTPQEREAVIATMLGEARGEGYLGMAAVAQTIMNRANVRDKPVSALLDKTQFNGAGFSGASSQLREVAEKALDAVLAGEDPAQVGYADHFATNSTSNDWTTAYADTANQLGGHTFYSSPEAQSLAEWAAIEKTPQAKPDFSSFFDSPANAFGLTELEDRPIANIDWNLGPMRPDKPTSGIQGVVAGVVGEMLGPGYSVNAISGMGDFGAPHRHPTGKALDYDIIDPQGNVVVDPDTLAAVTTEIAQRTGGSTGYALDGGYMGMGRIHSDFVTPQSVGAAAWSRGRGYSPITGAEAIEQQLYDAAMGGGIPQSKPSMDLFGASSSDYLADAIKDNLFDISATAYGHQAPETVHHANVSADLSGLFDTPVLESPEVTAHAYGHQVPETVQNATVSVDLSNLFDTPEISSPSVAPAPIEMAPAQGAPLDLAPPAPELPGVTTIEKDQSSVKGDKKDDYSIGRGIVDFAIGSALLSGAGLPAVMAGKKGYSISRGLQNGIGAVAGGVGSGLGGLFGLDLESGFANTPGGIASAVALDASNNGLGFWDAYTRAGGSYGARDAAYAMSLEQQARERDGLATWGDAFGDALGGLFGGDDEEDETSGGGFLGGLF